MSKQQRCTSCGGFDFVTAIDNHGQPYQGCPRCVIEWPPIANADDGPAVAREVAARSNRERLNSHANAVHTCDTLATCVIAQAEELAKLRHTGDVSDIVKAAREWLSLHDRRDDYWTGDFAEAVVAMDGELAKLRAEVAAYDREIDRIAHGNTLESDAMCVNELEVVNLRGENVKLRAALREALNGWHREHGDDYPDHPIYKLRRLADGE